MIIILFTWLYLRVFYILTSPWRKDYKIFAQPSVVFVQEYLNNGSIKTNIVKAHTKVFKNNSVNCFVAFITYRLTHIGWDCKDDLKLLKYEDTKAKDLLKSIKYKVY